ncbi:hypothetical protein [Periweissella cryptocerci]|nr:hypothetical protein [Periweissella cryptocerci]
MNKSEVGKYAKLLVSVLFEWNSNQNDLYDFVDNYSDGELDDD